MMGHVFLKIRRIMPIDKYHCDSGDHPWMLIPSDPLHRFSRRGNLGVVKPLFGQERGIEIVRVTHRKVT